MHIHGDMATLDMIMRGTSRTLLVTAFLLSSTNAYAYGDEEKEWKEKPGSRQTEYKTEEGSPDLNCGARLEGERSLGVACTERTSQQVFERSQWMDCEYRVTEDTEVRDGGDHFWKGSAIGGLSLGLGGVVLAKKNGDTPEPAVAFFVGGLVGGLIGGIIGYENAPRHKTIEREPTGLCMPRQDSNWKPSREKLSDPQPSSRLITITSPDLLFSAGSSYAQTVRVTPNADGRGMVQFTPSQWFWVISSSDLKPYVLTNDLERFIERERVYYATITATVAGNASMCNGEPTFSDELCGVHLSVPLRDVRPSIASFVKDIFSNSVKTVAFNIRDAETYAPISCTEIAVYPQSKVPTRQQILGKYFRGPALDYAVSVAPQYVTQGGCVFNSTTISLYFPGNYNLVTVCPTYTAFDNREKKPVRISSETGYVEVFIPKAPNTPPLYETATLNPPRVVVR